MTENDDAQLAYAAGLFDAKGEFIADQPSGISLHIADEHYEAIIRAMFALNGGKYWHSHSGSHTMHHLEISHSLELVDALEDMLPYLICKKREAWETYKQLRNRQLERAYARIDLLRRTSAPKTRHLFARDSWLHYD
jgi:hypothetical protein